MGDGQAGAYGVLEHPSVEGAATFLIGQIFGSIFGETEQERHNRLYWANYAKLQEAGSRRTAQQVKAISQAQSGLVPIEQRIANRLSRLRRRSRP
jgi:hypothetical protein